MKSLLLIGALFLAGATMPTAAFKEVVKEDLDTRIIVQLDGNPLELGGNVIKAQQSGFLRSVSNYITKDYEVVDKYTSLVNGIVMNVNSSRVASIRKIPGVKYVDYDKAVYTSVENQDELVSTELSIHVTEDKKNISAGTVQIPAGTKRGEGTSIAILDTGALLNATYYDSQKQLHTGVTHNTFTDLDAEINVKYTQQGIQDKIQQYETAGGKFHGKKDSTHSTYWNRKVPFYYDYGGSTTVYGEPGKEDYDVYEPGQPHGTHVASLAAGNDPHYKGIAYNAQILVMKVFTKYTPTGSDVGKYGAYCSAFESCILKALEDCYALGVDVINLSLGSNLTDFLEKGSVATVLERLEKGGSYVNFAAGNNGKDQFDNTIYEYWTTDMIETGELGSYASNPHNMSVAAAQADEEYYENALVVDGKTISYADQVTNYKSSDGDVTYNPERRLTDLLGGQASKTLDWVRIPGWGQAADYAGIDAKDKIAVCDRGGGITFVEKITAAQTKGAIACVIVDNDASNTSFNSRMALQDDSGKTWTPNIPVIYSLFKDKTVWDNAAVKTLNILSKTETTNPTARTMATFSSDGATYDLSIKPEISAPGQCILGAVMEDDNGNPSVDLYDYYDGTSMACPNYCGASALLLAEIENKKSVNNRFMSTATIMKDRFGTNFESVRRQGAGLIDVKGAIETPVYLDGTTNSTLTGKAKIELGNNREIARGDLKLSFTAVNESNDSITYTATTYAYRPELVSLDEDFYPAFAGKKFQATYDHFIGKVSQDVTVNANGNTLIELDTYKLPESALEEIDEYFDYGTYIEGYVVLTADGYETLSIPFLGFYGDLSAASPVEPFEFEKDPDKVYPSDTLNYLIQKNLGLAGDYSSDWVYCNAANMGEIDLTNWLYNETSLRSMTYIVDSKVKNYTPIGLDPKTNQIDPDNFVVGNNGMANTMIISQYVTRTVETNYLTLTKKSNGKQVLLDHMFDSFIGALENEAGVEYQWPLTKSHVDTDYWSSGLVAHRAYTIIPMYNYEAEYNEITGEYEYTIGDIYEAGEYEIEFHYTCAEGSTFSMKYDLIVDNSSPSVNRYETITKDGEQYTRCYIDSTALSFIAVNGYEKMVETDEQGNQYYDVKNSEISNGLLFVKCTSFNNCTCCSLTHVGDVNNLSLENANLNSTINFNAEIDTATKGEIKVDISFTKGKKSYTLAGETKITFKKFEAIGTAEFKLYIENIEGEYEEAEYTLENGYVTFYTLGSYSFKLTYTPTDPGPGPQPEPKKGGCGSSLVISGSAACAIALAGIVLAIRKKKED